MSQKGGIPVEDKSLTAEDWNREFKITNGSQIIEILRPFYEKPLGLQPPISDLSETLTAAFAEFDFSPKRIEIISIEDCEREFAHRLYTTELSELWQFLGLDPKGYLGWSSHFFELDSGLKEAECHSLPHVLPRYPDSDSPNDKLWHILWNPIREFIHSSFPNALWKKSHFSLIPLVSSYSLARSLWLQIGLVIIGRSQEAEIIAPFTKFFCAGNYILRLWESRETYQEELRESTVLVLVK